jgi:hypothetical protein
MRRATLPTSSAGGRNDGRTRAPTYGLEDREEEESGDRQAAAHPSKDRRVGRQEQKSEDAARAMTEAIALAERVIYSVTVHD